MTLEVTLDDIQSRAFSLVQPGRICTFPLGRGVGKTFLGRALIHRHALENPGAHIGILYPSLKMAKAVIWPGLIADYTHGLKPYVHRPNLTEFHCTYRNGARVTTWGAENANSIRGQRFDFLMEDESDDIDPDVETAVVQPTFSRSGTKSVWLKFGTPRRGRYGSIFKDFKVAEEQARGMFRDKFGELVADPKGIRTHYALRAKSSESPQVDREWLANVRAQLLGAGKGPVYEREYECNFDSAEGLVYSMFDTSVHVAPALPKGAYSEILIGCDWGFEDPAVFEVVGVGGGGNDARCHVIEEFYKNHKTPSELVTVAKALRAKYPMARWYADPSRPDAIVEFKNNGIRIEPANNAIEDGVGSVADRFRIFEETSDTGAVTRRWTRLLIDPSCVHTLEEVGKYRRKRDPKNVESVLDDIEDRNNHAMDALRYAIFTRFGKPKSERIVVNDRHTYG